MATLRNPVAQWLRNHIAPVVSSFGFVQDKIKNAMSELSINYRHGPLSAEKWPWLTGGLAAGDRLCDAPLKSATSGPPTTLFRAIHGTRHALLLLPSSNEREAISHLLKIADEAGRTFPVLSPHIILKAAPSAPAPDIESGVPAWIDSDGRLHQKFHATGQTLIVVRPDGYIGYRCQPADGEALLAYLSGFLVGKR
jgi:hypothetical protein